MGLLSRVARQAANRLAERRYTLPLGDGVTARMTIHRATDRKRGEIPPRWFTRMPFGARLTEMSMPKVDVINWGFGDQSHIINKLEPQTKVRVGLRAMREVLKALERDVRTRAPARYEFVGATPTHRRLYDSLLNRANSLGYEASPGYAGSVLLSRQFTPTGEYVAQDAMSDALLYGGAGAGLYGAALARD